MKRSTKLALVSVAGVAAVLAYSHYSNNADAETDGTIYNSVADCVSAGQDEASCKARFGEALATYNKTAPRFMSQTDCEKDFGAGRCIADPSKTGSTEPNTAQASSGGYFMPMMMGFMAGRLLSGAQGAPMAAAPMYGCASPAAASASCYSSSSGRTYSYSGSGGGHAVRTSVSEFRSSTSRSNYSVVPRGGSSIVSRGGFGSTGRSFSARGGGG